MHTPVENPGKSDCHKSESGTVGLTAKIPPASLTPALNLGASGALKLRDHPARGNLRQDINARLSLRAPIHAGPHRTDWIRRREGDREKMPTQARPAAARANGGPSPCRTGPTSGSRRRRSSRPTGRARTWSRRIASASPSGRSSSSTSRTPSRLGARSAPRPDEYAAENVFWTPKRRAGHSSGLWLAAMGPSEKA